MLSIFEESNLLKLSRKNAKKEPWPINIGSFLNSAVGAIKGSTLLKCRYLIEAQLRTEIPLLLGILKQMWLLRTWYLLLRLGDLL